MSKAATPFTVLGADGFVGRALCAHLDRAGIPFRDHGRHDGDFFNRPLGHAIYCIGLTADFANRPFDTVEAHVTLFAKLLERAEFDSLTYLSSTRLYDDAGGHGQATGDLTVNPAKPRHLYDLSKALGESLCLTGGRDHVRAARLACVYDPDLSADNYLHRLLRDVIAGRTIRMTGPACTVRDYVAMDDVCRSLVAIARRGRRQIYNVASGCNVTNAELAALIGSAGGKVTTEWQAGQFAEAAPEVDVSPLDEDFGIRPRPLHEVLPAIVAEAPSSPDFEKRIAV